ncbi:Gfo/Idh/MocA family protein [Nocardia bovistercoris]|uniref:Gfo/Idh/MocA family oxidoreductase n=1 Tax=Nocardia bovistercoris TaxID=2785916 RepID=A0A931IKA7_9NOCA|nr:Gfo/Idh/MocA family oxidoreductase [Nocardia bovistercoris]MBH0781830.1 Gfo/Idh/MocA family oxidoreductase [Nocardia bovistercoris]
MIAERRVGIGLAGTGRIGTRHAEILARSPRVERLLLTDVDADRASAVAGELGVESVPDIDALLDADLDGLVVATPTDSHPELIVRAVERGIPVFCEKPVAADLAGTAAVVARLRDAPVPVQVGFQRRFDAGYRAARDAVRSGELGRLHTVRANTLDPAPPPADYLRRSGGIFRDCGVHDFDIVGWVTGREVVRVYAHGTDRGEAAFTVCGDVGTAAVLLTLDDDTLVTVSLTRRNGAGYDVRLELLGERTNLVVGLDDRTPLRSAEPGDHHTGALAYPGFLERFHRAYIEELDTFVAVAADDLPSPCPPEAALTALRIAEACELSRHERRPVDLTEIPYAPPDRSTSSAWLPNH